MKTNSYFYISLITTFLLAPFISILAQDIELEGDNVTITGPSADLFLLGDGTNRSQVFFGSGDNLVADAKISLNPTTKLFKIGDFVGGGLSMTAGIADPGKIGIGTSNDLKSMLKILGNSGNSTTPAHLELVENNNSDFARIRYANEGSVDYWDMAAKSNGTQANMNFFYYDGATGSNIMTIDGITRKVAINDSSPEYTLEVNHENGTPQSGVGNGLFIKNIGVVNDEDWLFYVNGLNGINQGDLELYENGNLRGRFDDVTGNYNPVSDRRFKENILDLSDGQLSTIMKLRPTSYNMKNDPDYHVAYGFIAQEVMEILPHLVGAGNSHSAETELTLSYTQLIPVITKAIQEQQEQINKLTKEIRMLKGQ